MAYPIPTLKDLSQRIERDILSRVQPGQGILRRAVLKIFAVVWGGAIYLCYGFIKYMADQMFVSTSEKEFAETHALEWGKTRKASTPSTGKIRVTGVNSTVIPQGTTYLHSNGIEYEVILDATIATGFVLASVRAKTDGFLGNIKYNEPVVITTPISGAEDTATVDVDGLNGGTDTEADDKMIARVLNRIQKTPEMGRAIDYETWIAEVPGITQTRVFSRSDYFGAGSIGLFFINDEGVDTGKPAVVPSSVDIATVQAAMDQKKPIGAYPFVITPVQRRIGLTVTVYPDDLAVITNVVNSLKDMFKTETDIGTTLRLQQIRTAIGRAVGEIDHDVTGITSNGITADPTADIPVAKNEIAVLYDLTINGTVEI